MAGSINDFISSFNKVSPIGVTTGELSRPCNFDVDIAVTQSFIDFLNTQRSVSPYLRNLYDQFNDVNDLGKMFRLRCEQSELPPRAFSLIQQKTYGPLEFYPVQNIYNKTTMTFICQGNMREKVFFDLWMELICTTHPDYNYALNNFVRFDFAYKTKYTTEIKIHQKDLEGNDSYTTYLRDAFPVEVFSIPLSWNRQNDYNRLNVVFAYRYHYNK